MNAKELRIGNYVQYDSQLRGWTLDKVHPEYFIEGALKNVKPVPITKKWLLSFGFELIEDGFDSDEGGIVCVLDFGIYRIFWSAVSKHWKFYRRVTKEYEGLQDLYISKLSHLHQLQNLYFALTQTELVLNEA